MKETKNIFDYIIVCQFELVKEGICDNYILRGKIKWFRKLIRLLEPNDKLFPLQAYLRYSVQDAYIDCCHNELYDDQENQLNQIVLSEEQVDTLGQLNNVVVCKNQNALLVVNC